MFLKVVSRVCLKRGGRNECLDFTVLHFGWEGDGGEDKGWDGLDIGYRLTLGYMIGDAFGASKQKAVSENLENAR